VREHVDVGFVVDADAALEKVEKVVDVGGGCDLRTVRR
jgi:hypothetical protein